MPTPSAFDAYLGDLCSVLGNEKRHASFVAYQQGLMLPIERKSVEPIAAHVRPDDVRSAHQSLHHFVSTSPWSDRALLDKVFTRALEAMGTDTPGYWMIDDTGIPKKGKHSVGVSHQYCGQLGKQANCQVAVSLSYATEGASVPIDYTLYLPEGWASDAERRAGVGVPEEVEFRTRPEIALEQLRAACERGVPRQVVLADAGYGDRVAFREGCDELGLQYVVGVKGATTVWPPGGSPLPPASWSGRGRKPKNQRLAPGHEPLAVETLGVRLPSGAWRWVEWRVGTNETLRSRFARVRVRAAHLDHLRTEQRPEQWLLIEWPEGREEPMKFWLSTLPGSSSLKALVHAAKMRWRIERDCQELKSEFGLNHYEGRNWRGFHHHASLCIAAYAFLVIERLRHPGRKKKRRAREEPALPEDYVPRGARAAATAR